MTRILGIGNYGESESGFMFDGSSGFMLMLGMVVLSISIMSILIFACADHGGPAKPPRNHGGPAKPPRRRPAGRGGGISGGAGGGGGFGGDGGGGGGCGGGGGS
ncbi:hypothetical protein ABFX02_10G048400 [Erythranthe guttata]